MRTNTILSVLLLAASTVVPGCSCLARDAETYRADTRTVLETRNDAIKTCYDEALKADPALDGTVVVTFKVEKKTGKLLDIATDTARTQAPAALSDCIVKALDGLTLEPVDQRQGDATFSWTFKANPPKQL
ncbi:MAG: AgmX/PglI C-terminal domain-containing protein [Nannocystis sp.]|nr:AgmX/PglI C-terminal domain-containing protein [Nannocystis sp.]MBA3546877.1 AgmX/PglI C-terminal domain-containing protein [Nannocystis sp.]